MGAELDFNINNHAVVNIGGIELWITDTFISMWIIMGVLILLAVVVRIHLTTYKEIPRGFQNFVEMLIERFDNFIRSNAGDKLHFLGGWFFTVVSLIFLSSVFGMFIHFRPPTADWAFTIALAMGTFFLIHVMGAIFGRKAYWKEFISPIFLFLPINLLGELARPLSLSARLFGNILGGMILMSVFYGLTPIFVQLGIPMALHGIFDLFFGVLQTYVFAVLSLAIIGVKAGTSE